MPQYGLISKDYMNEYDITIKEIRDKLLKQKETNPKLRLCLSRSYYKTYIKSSYWKEVKSRLLKNKNNRKCKICNKHENLEVHHKSYRRLGFEKLLHLIVLCSECHKKLHSFYNERIESGIKKNLFRTTNMFVKRGRKTKHQSYKLTSNMAYKRKQIARTDHSESP